MTAVRTGTHQALYHLADIPQKIRQIAGGQFQIPRMGKPDLLRRLLLKLSALQGAYIIRSDHHLIFCAVIRQTKNRPDRLFCVIKPLGPKSTADPDGIF